MKPSMCFCGGGLTRYRFKAGNVKKDWEQIQL